MTGLFRKSCVFVISAVILGCGIIAVKDGFGRIICKRIAAQTAAFIVDRIYDPYAGTWKMADNGYIPALDSSANLTLRQWESYLLRSLPRFKVLKFNNNFISDESFDFDYQQYEEEKLRLLRERFGLESVVSPAKTEFEKFVLLMNWVRHQWRFGRPGNVEYNFNAIDILERGRSGAQFCCSEYATTYVQCAVSLGFEARYAGLFAGHVVAEVWSDELAKWAVMDVTHNCYYKMNGVPLNTLELHRSFHQGIWQDVEVVRLPLKWKFRYALPSDELVKLFQKGFYVRMRNDWFTNRYPHWYPKSNSVMNGLEWIDECNSNNKGIARETKDEGRINFPVNVSALALKGHKTGPDNAIILEVGVNTFTPNFSHFLISMDNQQPYAQKEYALFWPLHEGTNILRVKSVNKFSVQGVESEIVLQGAPMKLQPVNKEGRD